MILLTGATGHLGSWIYRSLLERREKLRVLLLPSERSQAAAMEHDKTEVVFGDLGKPETLPAFFENAEGAKLIHCAGAIDITNRRMKFLRKINVEGTRALLELAEKSRIKRFLYVSSVHALPIDATPIRERRDFDPARVVGDYAKTKAEATALVIAAGEKMETVVVHPAGIIGPGDTHGGHMSTLVRKLLSGKIPALARGGYDFVDVRDVAEGVIKALDGPAGETYILSNERAEISEIANELGAITGKKMPKHFVPHWILKCVVPISEWWDQIRGQKPLFTSYSILTLTDGSVYDHTKATRMLGYRPRRVYESTSDMVEEIKAHKK